MSTSLERAVLQLEMSIKHSDLPLEKDIEIGTGVYTDVAVRIQIYIGYRKRNGYW